MRLAMTRPFRGARAGANIGACCTITVMNPFRGAA